MQFPISIDDNKLASFCQRWKVMEASLFGSVAHGKARPDSDVDILVSFSPDAQWSLLDHIAMEGEISELLQRKVDLVTRRSVERSANKIRRQSILEGAVPMSFLQSIKRNPLCFTIHNNFCSTAATIS